MMKIFFAYIFGLALKKVSGSSCSTVPFEDKCAQGCYFAGDVFNQDGTRPCTPVGPGHYSPAQDNHRYPCTFGTFSRSETAGNCLSCPPGTFAASVGSTECNLCPSASYTSIPMSIFCSPCDPERYNGPGANAIEIWDNKVYCSFQMILSEVDTSDPIHAEKPETPEVDNEGTSSPNAPSITNNDTAGSAKCGRMEYKWHGDCMSCPNTVRTILQPIWICLFFGIIIMTITVLPDSSVLWLGLEYLQLVFILGFASDIHPVHAHVNRWILSIFFMDLDAGFSWQCLLNAPQDWDHIIILLVPLAVFAWSCFLSRFTSSIRTERWIIIGFHLAHFKLLLTSMEALHCDEDENNENWYCYESILSFGVGVLGMTLYGLGAPAWMVWRRYSHSKDATESRWTHDLGFRSCWWWPGFCMIRRTILAIILSSLPEEESLILMALLVLLMATELCQRFALPIEEQDNVNAHEQFRRHTVNAVLHASLVCLTGLEFLSLVLRPETLLVDGLTIAIFFSIICLLTTGYWLTTLASEYFKIRHHSTYPSETDRDEANDQPQISTGRDPTCRSPAKGVWVPSYNQDSTHSTATDQISQHNLSVSPRSTLRENSGSTMADDKDGLVSDRNGSLYSYVESGSLYSFVDTGSLYSYIDRGSTYSYADEGRSLYSLVEENQRRDSMTPSLQSESTDSRFSLEVDDTSTLTDNNSYLQIIAPCRSAMQPVARYSPDISERVRSPLKSSKGNTPATISNPMSEYYSSGSYRRQDTPRKNEETQNEVWIDEATGCLVTNKAVGNWADASTGIPMQP